jgi:hypothetical protein
VVLYVVINVLKASIASVLRAKVIRHIRPDPRKILAYMQTLLSSLMRISVL